MTFPFERVATSGDRALATWAMRADNPFLSCCGEAGVFEVSGRPH
jgi:hypothetical protein